MKKIYLLFVGGIFHVSLQATSFYSKGSLSVDQGSSWNTNMNGSGTDAQLSDFSSGNTFIIQNGHSMSNSAAWSISGSGSQLIIEDGGAFNVTQATSLSQLLVNSGGSLSISSGITMSITNGNPLGFDMQVSGQLSNAGTLSYGSSGTGTFLAGSVYRHLYTTSAGTVPAATWHNNSTCEMAGYTSNASTPGGLSQSFGNFTWNCSSQSTNINLSGNLQTINGNFTLSSSGTGSLRLTASASPGISVGGNFIVSSGTLNLSSGTGITTLYLNANMSVATASSITETGSGSATINFIKSGTQSIDIDGSILNDISYTVSFGSTLELLSDITVNSTRSFSISGRLNAGTYKVSGSGAFQLLSGGVISSTAANGLKTLVQCTGSNTFNSNASYEFAAVNTNPNFSMFSITAMKDLSLSGGGTDTLDADIEVSGSLELSSTRLLLADNDLILASSGSISGYGSDAYLISNGNGVLKRELVASGSAAFPVGTLSDYFPLTISLSAGSSNDIFAVRVTDEVLSSGSSGVALNSNVVDASWYISEENPGSSVASLSFQWPNSAELNSFDRSNAFISQYNVAWDLDAPSSAGGSGPYTLSRSGITSFSIFSIGDDNSALPVSWLSFEGRLIHGKSQLIWSTASEYNNKEFQVQFSEDAVEFKTVGIVPASGKNEGDKYNYLHHCNSPARFYRIRQLDMDGNESFSKMIRLEDSEHGIIVSNLKDNSILISVPEGSELKIFDLNGRMVFSESLRQGQNYLSLDFLAAGIYVMETKGKYFKLFVE